MATSQYFCNRIRSNRFQITMKLLSNRIKFSWNRIEYLVWRFALSNFKFLVIESFDSKQNRRKYYLSFESNRLVWSLTNLIMEDKPSHWSHIHLSILCCWQNRKMCRGHSCQVELGRMWRQNIRSTGYRVIDNRCSQRQSLKWVQLNFLHIPQVPRIVIDLKLQGPRGRIEKSVQVPTYSKLDWLWIR